MKVTKKEIADYLGISRTAVSLTLNRSPKCSLSEATQARIFRAARELGYMDDSSGGGIKRICLAMCDLDKDTARRTNSVVLNDIEELLEKRDYHVMYMCIRSNKASYERLYEYLDSGDAAGVILYNLMDRNVIDRIKELHVPYLVISEIGYQDDNIICPDSVQCARFITAKLIELGHRKIALFLHMLDCPQCDSILRGYREALQEANIPFDPALVRTCPSEDGKEAILQMELLNLDYTAVVCSNIFVQTGAYCALIERGIRVPDDKSLISYSDFDQAVLTLPKMTGANCMFSESMNKAIDDLIDCINDGRTVLPFSLVDQIGFHPGETIGPPPEEKQDNTAM